MRSLRALALIGLATSVAAMAILVYLKPTLFRHSPTPAPSRAPVAFPTASLNDLQVASSDVAWVFMKTIDRGNPLLVVTGDGGRTWRNVILPPVEPNQKYGMQLIDGTHGTLQLSRGLMATADAGHSWHQVQLPPGLNFGLGAHFLNASRGWYQDLAAYPNQDAQPSSMWWTTDSGSTWTLLWQVDAGHPSAGAIPLTGSKFVLGFDGMSGWLEVRQGESTRLLETLDGGHVWAHAKLPLPDSSLLYSVEALPDGSYVLLALTDRLWWAITSRDGQAWRLSGLIPMSFPSDTGAYDRPTFLDSRHWYCTFGPLIRTTQDGGQTWHDVQPRLPSGIAALHDLRLFAGGRGWATAEDESGGYHVLTTSDGGATWTVSPVPQLEHMR